MTATVFDIQRFSVHDGPGIRTTVFFKGCPLRCRWCHNPEGLSPVIEPQFLKEECIGCHLCGGERSLQAAKQCPTGALRVCGTEHTIGDLMDVILRDRDFYGTDGGVTCSGGECLLQADFVSALLRTAKAAGIGTAIDTCGLVPWSAFEKTMPFCDRYLYDIKCADPIRHKAFTGADNACILDNLRKLGAAGAKIWLRVPVIPSFNDTDTEMAAIAQTASSVPIEGVTLIPYHALGVSKYETVGRKYTLSEITAPTKETLSRYADIFTQRGCKIL